jgi:NTP pyrophosphatase (non-canonical NTP hydrolase)
MYESLTGRIDRLAVEAAEAFGEERQLRKLQEECCECATAVAHFIDGKLTLDELASEVADVLICARFAHVNMALHVETQMSQKLDKLERRLPENTDV